MCVFVKERERQTERQTERQSREDRLHRGFVDYWKKRKSRRRYFF